jgi:hypothetical protein
MSVRTLARVWELSRHSGTHLLMMLAIADFADDDGNAYPAVSTLATKCRMKARNARYLLQELTASGELAVIRNAGPKGANRYKINIPLHSIAPLQQSAPLHSIAATPAMDCRPPLHSIAPEPSLNRQEPLIGNSNELLVGMAADEKSGRSKAKKKIPACPHQEIISLYHEFLPASPGIRDWTPARAAHLRARWNEDQKRQNMEWWKKFFAYVAESDFLTGRVSSNGRKPFTASLEWLVKAENFAKVREGRYHNEGSA